MLDIVNSSRTASVGEDSRKSWEMMIIDSLIIGGISLFTELVSGPPTWLGLYKAVTACGLAFFIQLAVERGLKRP